MARANPYDELVSRLRTVDPKDPQFLKRLNELVSLNELLTTLNTARTLDETLDLMLLTIFGQFGCRKGAIYVKSGEAWRVGIAKGVKESEVDPTKLPASETWDDLPGVIRLPENVIPGAEFFSQHFRLVFPIRNEKVLVGFICLGRSLFPDGGEGKVPLLATIADFGGVLIGNSLYRENLVDANKQLQRQLFQLNTLYEITGSFARCFEEAQVFQVLSNNLMGQFFISRCAVLVEEDGAWRVWFQKGIKAEEGTSPGQLTPLKEWPDRVLDAKETDCNDMSAFMKAQRLAYVLPISGEKQREGLLLLGDRLDKKLLSDADRDFVSSLANQSATALENIRLQREAAEKRRMEKELALAREIQQKLIPKGVPEVDGYEIAAEMRPYYQVGGDFYDFITQEGGRLIICLADVSGKSLPASMIMSTAQASLRALNAFGRHTPREIIEKLNLHMWQSTQSNKFITMFYAVLDPATHQMDYINAGHNRPFLIRPGGKVEELGLGGMVLGLFPAATYEVGSVQFEEGTELIIFTDGLSEVTNNENEEYGDVLMMDTLLKVNGQGTAEEAKCSILDDALEFCSNEMVDDLTLLLVRRKKGDS